MLAVTVLVPVPEPPPRPEPPALMGERATLEAWLEFHRATLLARCAGLDGEQLAMRSAPPSTLSLLGLVRHLTDVERGWFLRRWTNDFSPLHWSADNPDGAFDDVDPARARQDVETYVSAVRCVGRRRPGMTSRRSCRGGPRTPMAS